jgi:hypothetical protein
MCPAWITLPSAIYWTTSKIYRLTLPRSKSRVTPGIGLLLPFIWPYEVAMSALIGLMLAFLGFMYLIWRLSCWIFDFDPRQYSFWKWLATGLLLSIFFGD